MLSTLANTRGVTACTTVFDQDDGGGVRASNAYTRHYEPVEVSISMEDAAAAPANNSCTRTTSYTSAAPEGPIVGGILNVVILTNAHGVTTRTAEVH